MAISGSLSTVRSQTAAHVSFQKTFSYLDEALRVGTSANKRLLAVPIGDSQRVELGDGIFALEQAYLTKSPAEGRWESHLKFIDVQVIVSGEERMGLCETSRLDIDENLTPAKDLIFYKSSDQGSTLLMKAGDVAILFPPDGHMPGIQVAQPVAVRKIVVKVPVW
ncbi:MAG: YhcH/YjgK/YiaL family protein [Opitutaceae bacterium]|jgi:YhcH/YjgK/YiaL family protein